MTPLEALARAISPFLKREADMVDAARAGVLALAACDFKGPHLLPDEAFKARLRSIASGKDK